MTFGRLLSILRARWWVSLAVLFVTVGATLAVVLLMPPRYTATASILIDGKPDPLTTMVYGGAPSASLMATQIDVIESDRVGLRVVRDLKLTDDPQVRMQWQAETKGQGSFEAWLSDRLRRSVDAVPSSVGSNIILLSYKAPDPRFAAALANAFVKGYIETSLELRVDPAKQYSVFFDSRAKEARDQLEQAQSRLTGFQQKNGIVVTDERLDIENARLNELSSQLVALQSVATESSMRQAQVAGGAADRMQEVLNNGLVASLKGDLVRYEAKLKEIGSRLGENHPQVLELKATISELTSRLNSEIAKVSGGVKVSDTINRQREAQLRSVLEAQRGTVMHMKTLRDEGAVLMRDVDSAQRAYDAVLARLTTSSLESRSTQSNAYALSDATAPTDPSFPKIGLSLAVASLVGVLLGVVATLGLELIDRRLRVAEDVTEALGLPIIGVLPRPAQRRLFGAKKKASKMQQRLIGHFPATAKGA